MNIELISLSLKCDNPSCDYTVEDINREQVPGWINRPCPKCGENLLTQEDHDRWDSAARASDLINTMTPEQLKALGDLFGVKETEDDGRPVIMEVSTHKSLSITVKNEDGTPYTP